MNLTDASHINFTNANIFYSIFDYCHCSNALFYEADSLDSSFEEAYLVNADFRYSRSSRAQFIQANMDMVQFSYVRFFEVNFQRAELLEANLSYGTFDRSNFQSINANEATFTNAMMPNSDFTEANLIQTDFTYTDLHNAIFTDASLGLANLSFANLVNANISNQQLAQTISIRGARLPDGSIGRYINLLSNGYADCHRALNEDWQIEEKNSIVVSILNQTSNNCVFKKNSPDSIASKMSQKIHLGLYIILRVAQGGAIAVLHTTRSTSNITLSLTSIESMDDILEKQSMGESTFSF